MFWKLLTLLPSKTLVVSLFFLQNLLCLFSDFSGLAFPWSFVLFIYWHIFGCNLCLSSWVHVSFSFHIVLMCLEPPQSHISWIFSFLHKFGFWISKISSSQWILPLLLLSLNIKQRVKLQLLHKVSRGWGLFWFPYKKVEMYFFYNW